MRVFMLLNGDGVTVKSFYAEDLFGTYPNDGYPAGVVEITPEQWQDYRDHQGFRRWDVGTSSFTAHDPGTAAAPARFLTGPDVIDGLSKTQAAASDMRDLVRIQAAPMASMVRSKIARVAKANGVAPEAVTAQATATGGQ